MAVLVIYASKHGATQGIADRIGTVLTGAGIETSVRPVRQAGDLGGYEAYVIGSAVFATHWLREASGFIRGHREILMASPVWLFSSGPLGTATFDEQGNDVASQALPAEAAEFERLIGPRDHHVFFGALDPHKLGFFERLLRRLPAARGMLPEGDFRDWEAVDAWASEIARALKAGERQAVTASEDR